MKLFLECKPDEALARTLGCERKIITHCNDKGDVCKRLCKGREMKGLIDEDPMSAQPAYIRELQKKEHKRVYGVIHHIDHDRTHSIIVLCPQLEGWFLEACRNRNGRLNVGDFNLPNNVDDLHKVINFRLKNFENAVRTLLDRQNPAILHLQNLLMSE